MWLCSLLALNGATQAHAFEWPQWLSRAPWKNSSASESKPVSTQVASRDEAARLSAAPWVGDSSAVPHPPHCPCGLHPVDNSISAAMATGATLGSLSLQNGGVVRSFKKGGQTTQADLWIRTASENYWIGQDIYDAHGSLQIKRQDVTRGGTAIYILTLQNDGSVSDSFSVTGGKSHTGWQLRYFNAASGGADITAQVTRGNIGWSSPTLAPGATLQLRLEVYAEPNGNSPHDQNIIKARSNSGQGNQGTG